MVRQYQRTKPLDQPLAQMHCKNNVRSHLPHQFPS